MYQRKSGDALLSGILWDGDASVERPRSEPFNVALVCLGEPESGSVDIYNRLDYLLEGNVALIS